MSDTAISFQALEDADPARPGDPFSRVRYQYGQLLGAEDFAAEQRYHLLRDRLLTATLHGHGTVWGLRVTKREDATDDRVQLVCAPGLAVDALGRLIHVEQEVCLDVTGLALAEFWGDLVPPPDAGEDADTRRAYVVLSYRACLAEEVPAIAPPCNDGEASLAYSRVLDRWRLCLQAEPPDDPHPLVRDWTAVAGDGDLRDRLLDFVLDPPAEARRFWSNGDDAPLLLAVVDLEPVGDPVERTEVPGEPDNRPRALLPDVQTVAAMALGLRLVGADASQGFRLVSAAARPEGGQMVLDLRFTTPPHIPNLTADNLRVYRYDSTTGWAEAALAGWAAPDGSVEAAITVTEDWTEATIYQLRLVGAGPMPLMDTDGRPLAGMASDPVLPPGQGRDVSLVQTFTPET